MSRSALAWLKASPYRQVRYMNGKLGISVELTESNRLVGRGRGATPALALREAMHTVRPGKWQWVKS